PQYGVGDLVYVSPARRPSAACNGARPSGCLEYSYSTTTGHYLWKISDPRRDATNAYYWQLQYGGVLAAKVMDVSHSSTALLQVVSYDTGPGGAYTRGANQGPDAPGLN